MRTFLLQHPDEFYLPGIAALTFAIVSGVVLLLTAAIDFIVAGFACNSGGVVAEFAERGSDHELSGHAAAAGADFAQAGFSEGLPNDCVTLVAIPTLLLNEKQVRKLVDDLEVRFLGNHDPNLHYALLSDLPDSPRSRANKHPLVDLCCGADRWAQREVCRRKGMGRFSCSIGTACTTRAKDSGWDGNASAAS